MISNKNILHIVLNNFTNDSRVEKEVISLSKIGAKITVFALHDYLLSLVEKKIYGDLFRFRLITRSWPKNKLIQFIKYVECLIRMVWQGIRLKPACLHAHDLDALPIGFVLAKILSVPLIYDAHEFETEQQENPNRLLYLMSVQLERFLIKRVAAVITVSEGIAIEYANRYNISKPRLVFNCPPSQIIPHADKFREKFTIRNDQKIFLYQGALLPGRGIEKLLLFFSKTERSDAVIIFMGYGSLEPMIQKATQIYHNIFYHKAVSPDQLLMYTASADIGICTIENSCLSYYYCLPNKFFEYAMAGLPVLVSNLAEMKRIVNEYQSGIVMESDTVEGMSIAMDKIRNVDLKSYSANVRRMAEQYNWEKQEKVLFSIYKEVLSCAA